MKAIQAKSQQAKRHQQPSKVLPQKPLVAYTAPVAHAPAKVSSDDAEKTKSSQKTKKRYLCSMPDCHKSFYQKTHLDIHTRAHTGVKPFVSQAILMWE
jgi:transposase-like protein